MTTHQNEKGSQTHILELLKHISKSLKPRNKTKWVFKENLMETLFHTKKKKPYQSQNVHRNMIALDKCKKN